MGGIGIGGRGGYDLSCFLPQPDVQFLAVCDVKAARRQAVKTWSMATTATTTAPPSRPARAACPQRHRRRADCHGPNWHATASILAANAGKDVYCEKPCTKNIAQSLALAETFRRDGTGVPGGHAAAEPAPLPLRVDLARSGKLGKLQAVCPTLGTRRSAPAVGARPSPSRPKRWRIGTCTSARRPGGLSIRTYCNGFGFEKGGGMVGGGTLEWGSHCVDLCQWAADADGTAPVEYQPGGGCLVSARYASGVKLVVRADGWLPLGSCPVRFEGDAGWVEAGDSGKLVVSSPALLAGRKVAEIGGYPANFHVRDFLDCVKSRGKPLANADAACYSHIACHACNISMFLGRKLAYDPVKNEFLGDADANRLRSEALREPWRV